MIDEYGNDMTDSLYGGNKIPPNYLRQFSAQPYNAKPVSDEEASLPFLIKQFAEKL